MTVEKQKIAPALLQGGGFVVECGPAVALLVAAPAVLVLGGLLASGPLRRSPGPAPGFLGVRSAAPAPALPPAKGFQGDSPGKLSMSVQGRCL